jgi:predicted DNA-binding transcriptional regulator YafY
MNSPTTRALTLLELLQSHDDISGPALAERLGVDGRTLRRYVSRLQALGIPVVSERGRYGAYRLGAGVKLPPLMFSEDEAVAVSVGLLFADRLGGAQQARTKLERVMPTALRQRLRTLSATVRLDVTRPVDDLPSDVLLQLSAATHARQRVALTYGAANAQVTLRELDCYGLAWRGGRWYAVGFCQLRHAVRSFRLDRIQTVQPMAQRFTPPDGFDAVAHLAQGLATLPRAHAVQVQLKTDAATARAELFDAIGLFVPRADGVLLYSQTDDLAWYARQLARLSFDFEILQPPALHQALQAQATRLLALAQHQTQTHDSVPNQPLAIVNAA